MRSRVEGRGVEEDIDPARLKVSAFMENTYETSERLAHKTNGALGRNDAICGELKDRYGRRPRRSGPEVR
jgi:hypothetical protein